MSNAWLDYLNKEQVRLEAEIERKCKRGDGGFQLALLRKMKSAVEDQIAAWHEDLLPAARPEASETTSAPLAPATRQVTMEETSMAGKPVDPARYPFAIASHPTLEPEVKRAILANWASDVHAVESHPAFRQPPGLSEPVPLDAVLGALRTVDRQGYPDGDKPSAE